MSASNARSPNIRPVKALSGASDTPNLAETAYRTMLRMILNREVPGGTVIRERKLAEQLCISRTPMREAIGRLEGEGLLVRLTDRLLSVRSVTLQEYLHSLDVRMLVEPQAAALACQFIGDIELARLWRDLEELNAAAAPESQQHWDFDDALHGSIADASGNPLLASTIREMRRYTKMFERQTVPERSRPGGPEHKSILVALKARNRDKARAAMTEHLRQVRKGLLDGL